MVFDFKPFKLTTSSCFYAIILMVLSGLHELKCNEHALDFQKNIPVRVVWAVKGKDVDLPCDIATTVPGDYPKLILWFKDTTGIPLYSIDSRERNVKFGTHSAIASDLGERLFFAIDDNNSKNARLQIKNVQDTDGGVYRCRVDFFNSATRNSRINLTLVVPPDEPRIFDTHGKEISTLAGPFREGQEFFLSCQVNGGNPPPKVSWWRSDVEIPGTSHQSIVTGAVVNNILMRAVPRDYYATKLTCKAQGTTLIDPVEKEVTVQLHLKPLRVKLVSSNEILTAGVKSPLRCEAWGSAPPAKIAWFLDGIPIINADITSHSDSSDEGGNKTISIVTLTVAPENNDAELVCRASNPWFPSDIIEDKRIINVAYAPSVSVHLANEEPIPSRLIIRAERDNVTLKCRADANPPVDSSSFGWYKNGMRMSGENTETLHLTNLERQNIGEYSCSSRNDLGENHSSTITLRVQYAPRCKPGTEQSSMGSINMHSIDVRCEVDADPAENIRFSWTYNNTRNVSPVLNSRITSNGLVSTMTYLAPSDSELTLACWASNAVGRQEIPCLIHIIPAKLPDQPQHCELRNDTIFEVVCSGGSDGGLPQYFLLEVVGGNPVSPDFSRNDFDNNMNTNEISTMNDQATTAPLRRIKEAVPEFKLYDLEPGREYQFLVYAVNAKGRSHPPIVMQGKTFNDIIGPHDETILSEDPPTEISKQEKQRQSALIIIGAGAVAASSVIVALFAVLCRRSRPPQVTDPKPTSTEHQMKRLKPTRMPSMYAEEDGLDDFGRCADVRCTRAMSGQSTSHFISEGFVQYSQPSFNGMVELYQSSASINMCS
ncbi:B-cell receptor CD22 [Sitodiplosis mosellana]|uniref:B-cell receptor CD22 n=1 Tax=Sitodiplosis mosellana TaxID=263140 RepID=UPI002444B389|nr:B-cell receptor CD22 [Sitodiplosis mosellana]XP_055324551.1 B-cell receptor CD22 [Sitodiplosis mosellana]XP_055324552.1 B-cell receptor CD22 [Sitodiplosis mosellana]